MLVAHLSDLHLGLRTFPKIERGWNLRERDLAASFHAAVQELGSIRPDVVLLSGDIFDHPDPPSTAYLSLARGIRTLQELLPGVTVLAIAGERDTPSAPADPGPAAVLDALPGVEAASGAPRAVHLRELETHALLVPYRAVVGPPYPQLRPDPTARFNLLLLRGEPGPDPHALALDATGWDYVALGGGHDARIWDGPTGRVRTAGSLERVGTDPWKDGVSEKGFWTFDLASGEGEFHPVPGRPVVDLAPVRVDVDDPAGGSRRLRELLEGLPGGVDGKLLRIRLRGGSGVSGGGVLPGLLAGVRRRTAHLEVQFSPGERRLPTLPGSRRAPSVVPPRISWSMGSGDTEERRDLELTAGLWAVVAGRTDDRLLLAKHLADGLTERARSPHADGAEENSKSPIDPALTLKLHVTLHVPGVPREVSPSDSVETPDPPGTGRDASVSGRFQSLREDWIEAAGDLEARNLEWVRERQEAESRLTAYRDRARELKVRIRELDAGGENTECPTCHRPMGEAHPRIADELREEWEDVVQDGRWWKRRREQLDVKPQALRDLDRHVLELQARLEDEAEALVTDGMAGRPTSTGGHGDIPGRHGDARGAHGDAPRAHGDAPAGHHDTSDEPGNVSGGLSGADAGKAHTLALAGDFLARVTGGRIQGLAESPHSARLLIRDTRGELRAPGSHDLPLVAAALRLAEAEGPAIIVLDEFASSEEGDDIVRFLELLGSEDLSIPILAVVSPSVAQRIPELLAGTIRLQRDGNERPRIRASGTGRPTVRLASG